MPVTTKRRQPKGNSRKPSSYAHGKRPPAHHRTAKAIRNLMRADEHQALWDNVNTRFEGTLKAFEEERGGKTHIDNLTKSITRVAELKHPEDLMPHEASDRMMHMRAVRLEQYRKRINELAKGSNPKINKTQKAELLGLIRTLDGVREEHVSNLIGKSSMDGAALRPPLAVAITEGLPRPFRNVGRMHEGRLLGGLRRLAGQPAPKKKKAS